jgi:hypothetical protein
MQLLAALQYEQDIELLGIGGTIYYNHRRIDKLAAMTSAMPIPAKELGPLAHEPTASVAHPILKASRPGYHPTSRGAQCEGHLGR